jgi:hypothetical protein
VLLDEAVDLVEQTRYPLHFVDDHPLALIHRPQDPREELWLGQQSLVEGLIEKVDAMGPAILESGPGTLADPAGSEKEEALRRWLQDSGIHGLAHLAVIIP